MKRAEERRVRLEAEKAVELAARAERAEQREEEAWRARARTIEEVRPPFELARTAPAHMTSNDT